MNKLLKSPYIELSIMFGVLVLAFTAMFLLSIGAETPPGGMALTNVTWIILGSFLLSFAIAIIAVVAGIGGGVLFTPIMLAFTAVDSLVVRATGLIVAMFSGLVSTGPFMKSGVGNLKVCVFGCANFGIGAFLGAQGAIYIYKYMGVAGEAWLRIALGILIFCIFLSFIWGGKKIEYPTVKRVDRFSQWLNLRQPYYEESLGRVVDYPLTRAGPTIGLLVVVGMISGFFGLGAGWAMTPLLNLGMGCPLKVAAASSGIILGRGDSIGVWPYLLAGSIIPLWVAPWLVGQVVGGIIGAYLLIAVRAEKVRKILIGILFFTAFGLVTRGLHMLEVIPEVPGAVSIGLMLVIIVVVTLWVLDKLPEIRR